VSDEIPGPQEADYVQIEAPAEAASDMTWQPLVGDEALELFDHLALPKASEDRLKAEAVRILAHCVSPNAKVANETGLAIGYVQSGKTMSFTTVAALARDNGFRIVILIAGVSTPLLLQSTERLVNDLRINDDNRGWQLFESRLLLKNSQPGAKEQLRGTLNAWKSSVSLPFGWMKRTALIVVMKHHQHLDRVSALLDGIDLKGVPALIIDDEADQASLNAAIRRQDESKTYAKIKTLRARLPLHTYLQYTATPQAPLLLNIIDALSPHFVEVLTPGPDYVGGKQFFLSSGPAFIREIPENELPGIDPAEHIPESLLDALRLFFVGAAAGLITDKGKGNRSMLVHPSQQRGGHSEYYRWVMAVRSQWAKVLEPSGVYAEDREELLKDFREAYFDIAKTANDLPPEDGVFGVLPYVLSNTTVVEVNSRTGETPTVNWKSNYAHILVGGQAMDRGFTVEGLTVTYMPRSLGIGNADTVQQRARFFGYKRRYFGYCRVFLEDDSIDAYRRYVAHEEDVRARLIAHSASGKSLASWKRMFYLDSSLRPTRASVLELDYDRTSNIVRDWFTPRAPYVGSDAVQSNRALIKTLLAGLDNDLKNDKGSDRRTEYQKHRVADVGLATVFERCLVRLRFAHATDSRDFTVITIFLSELIHRFPDQACRIYVMSSGLARERSIDDSGDLKNLYQGAAPSAPRAEVGSIYPGDRKLFSVDLPTIQFHLLNVLDEEQKTIAKQVPTIAVHIPSGIAEDLLVQHQPHQSDK
jgi:hypothetical protein